MICSNSLAYQHAHKIHANMLMFTCTVISFAKWEITDKLKFGPDDGTIVIHQTVADKFQETKKSASRWLPEMLEDQSNLGNMIYKIYIKSHGKSINCWDISVFLNQSVSNTDKKY